MKLIVLFLLVFCIYDLHAQPGDSLRSQLAAFEAIKYYHSSMGINAAIYTGKEHSGYPEFYEGTAYYKEPAWQKGEIMYDGIHYPEVFLKYDMVKDEVIVRSADSITAIVLVPQRVSWFRYEEGKFIYIPKTDEFSLFGFYHELQAGKITLLARRKKIIDEIVTAAAVVHKFVEKKGYYVRKAAMVYPLKNEQAFYEAVGEKKNELKQYLKSKSLKYGKDPEAAMNAMIQYYNLLSR